MCCTGSVRAHSSAPMNCDQQHINALIEPICKELDLETELARSYVSEALRLAVVFDRKQRDYGSQNIAKFGEKGVLVRVTDKVERLKTLLWDRQDAEPMNEALGDTWDDLHVYALIGKLCRDKKWK